MAIHDTTRLAYIVMVLDEQQGKAIGFLSQALTWFGSHVFECRQVMSHNESAYISKTFTKLWSFLKHTHTHLALHTLLKPDHLLY